MLSVEVFAGLFLAVAGAAVVAVGWVQRRNDPARAALAELAEEVGGEPAWDDFSRQLAEPLPVRLLSPVAHGVSEFVAGLLPANMLDGLRRRLVLAGLSGRITAEELLTLHALAAVAGISGGFLFMVLVGGGQGVAVGALLVVIGLAVPRAWIDRLRDDRVEAIQADLPDMLDLLAISVEAGSGFEQALAMVVDRFSSGTSGPTESPLADEFGHMLREIQLGVSKRQALDNLRRRTQVGDLGAFITALVQADGLGMPISKVLRTQAHEMRRRRRQRVHEKANQLPVKLLFPMAMFILPSLFVVLLGPAVLQMIHLL